MTIAPDDAPAMFARLGKRAARHLTIDPDRTRCCLLVAAFLDRFGVRGHDVAALASIPMGHRLGLSRWYTGGLIYGWDGYDEHDLPRSSVPGRPDEWRQGNRDGLAAWDACRDAGLVAHDPAKPTIQPATRPIITRSPRPWKK